MASEEPETIELSARFARLLGWAGMLLGLGIFSLFLHRVLDSEPLMSTPYDDAHERMLAFVICLLSCIPGYYSWWLLRAPLVESAVPTARLPGCKVRRRVRVWRGAYVGVVCCLLTPVVMILGVLAL